MLVWIWVGAEVLAAERDSGLVVVTTTCNPGYHGVICGGAEWLWWSKAWSQLRRQWWFVVVGGGVWAFFGVGGPDPVFLGLVQTSPSPSMGEGGERTA